MGGVHLSDLNVRFFFTKNERSFFFFYYILVLFQELEVEFLFMLNFDLYAFEEEYSSLLNGMCFLCSLFF